MDEQQNLSKELVKDPKKTLTIYDFHIDSESEKELEDGTEEYDILSE